MKPGERAESTIIADSLFPCRSFSFGPATAQERYYEQCSGGHVKHNAEDNDQAYLGTARGTPLHGKAQKP